ncbi:MAG: Fur family transcriptional regulator [Acidimicrobiales bacterium]
MTPQRQCIFAVLSGNESHPTAEAVYRAVAEVLPAISLKTVYQTLHDLADMGEITQVDLGTGATRFDPNVEHAHHHLVCDRCAKVRDYQADVGPLEVAACASQGFEVGAVEIIFRGLCADCAPSSAAKSRPPITTKEHHG